MSKLRIDPDLFLKKDLNLKAIEAIKMISWHPIMLKYWALGGSSGWLGTNTTSIRRCPDSVGEFQHYANESIYYHPSIGVYEVHGLIRSHWSSLGWERSFLGYPKTDETCTGSIYWSLSTESCIEL